jgi:hypothetical protein
MLKSSSIIPRYGSLFNPFIAKNTKKETQNIRAPLNEFIFRLDTPLLSDCHSCCAMLVPSLVVSPQENNDR